MSLWVNHCFEPVYSSRSRVLILGTMPSPASREQGFYYSHPRNRFWPVTAAVLGRPVPQTAEEKRAFCLEEHIALWDVLSGCFIDGAADASIRQPEVNDIPALIAGTDIHTVCTTGSAAAKLYLRSFGTLAVRHIPLPSTSPANARMSLERLIEAYGVLRELLEK